MVTQFLWCRVFICMSDGEYQRVLKELGTIEVQDVR